MDIGTPPASSAAWSVTTCSIRLVAMIATWAPVSRPRPISAAATFRPVSWSSAQVSVRHAPVGVLVPDATWSLYAGRSPYAATVRAIASRTVRPATTCSISRRSSVTVMLLIVAPG